MTSNRGPRTTPGRCVLAGLTCILICLSRGVGNSQISSWTNLTSSYWETATNWAFGALPGATQTVLITNSGFKAVGISTATVSHPQCMTVSNLTVSAPLNAFNTLLMNYSGTQVPLRILNQCEIGQNGSFLVLYAGCEVGAASTTAPVLNLSGNLTVNGGLLIATNGTSLINGGTFNADGDCRFGQLTELGGNINQSSGTVTGASLSIGGAYALTNGIVSSPTVAVGEFSSGTFLQYGGTNRGKLYLGNSPGSQHASGNYSLYGGVVADEGMSVGSSAACSGSFYQYGGAVSKSSICVGCSFYSDPSVYNLQNGSVNAGYVSIADNAQFLQSGGLLTVTNNFDISGYYDDYSPIKTARFALTGGVLNAGSISMNYLASFSQSGGTNNVGSLSYYSTSYGLASGTLSASNTVLQPGHYFSSDIILAQTYFDQSGGSHRVAGTLTNFGVYTMAGGNLSANGIFQHGSLVITNGFSNPAVTNTGVMDLSGRLALWNTTQLLGSLQLSGNSSIDFGAPAATCNFLDSSAMPWVGGTVLTVTNWAGSTNGGGLHRLRFGNSRAALTLSQLSQIRFVNPGGFPPGSYFADALATGEVLPTFRPFLFSGQSGNRVVLNWTGSSFLQQAINVRGPYTDVPGASSPFTNLTAPLPRQFFRLRN